MQPLVYNLRRFKLLRHMIRRSMKVVDLDSEALYRRIQLFFGDLPNDEDHFIRNDILLLSCDSNTSTKDILKESSIFLDTEADINFSLGIIIKIL